MASSTSRLLNVVARRQGLFLNQMNATLRGNVVSSPFLYSFAQRWASNYPKHEIVGMPSLSPTMEAGTIASWNVKEGDSFGAGDVLCEIETDKATVSFEAQDDGVIAKILAKAGAAEIKCGMPIMITVDDASDVNAFKDYVAEASSVPIEAPSIEPVSKSNKESTITPPSVPSAHVSPTKAASIPAPSPDGRVIASPLAWTVAKEKGLDLQSIAIVGTGPNGRIIADDVREYIPLAAPVTPQPIAQIAAAPASSLTTVAAPIPHADYTDYPLSDDSIAIANLLSHSKQTIPHYYLTVDVTLDALIKLRATLNSALDEESKLSLNDLLIKASAVAMKACPSANASWMGDKVRMYKSVDINVVMGSGDRLYAPVVKGADSRGLKSISVELASNLKQIEEKSVEGDNFSAVGTVTFMNMGMYGIKSCAPIIRAPQAVALALGAAENRIVPNEGGVGDDIYMTSVALTATLSCDHRVVDGAVGAQFLSAFKTAVEKPETLLL